MSNNILSRGTQLAQTQWFEKRIEKRNSKITILLKGKFRTQSNIKNERICKNNGKKPFAKKLHLRAFEWALNAPPKLLKCKKQIKPI